ncbi:hypothetical protein TWF718_009939 [Orbilia javanica]|uniref:Peptidase A1 domain-containing protein n=1 Tax=Orbilia javanica TaxID=47235 RepID=A0AAN8MJQ9_9PEZI
MSFASPGMATKQPSQYLAVAQLVTISVAVTLLILTWLFSVLHNSNTINWGKPFEGSENIVSSKQPRQAPAEKKHVILPTFQRYTEDGELEFATYTKLNFGPAQETITLGLSIRDETWVPSIEAKTEFCRNQSVEACKLAEISGYYSLSGKDSSIPIRLSSAGSSSSETNLVYGNFYEDFATVDGVSVNFRFVVGDSWRVPPFLGLGLPTFQPDSPSSRDYIPALVEQGKVAQPYISFYDTRNPRGTGGEIVIGGVDRKKIYGGFDCWKNSGRRGRVKTPKVRIIAKDTLFDVQDTYKQPTKPYTLVSPVEPFLIVPPDILASLRLALPTAYLLGTNDFEDYLYTRCDATIDPESAIEFEFETVVIKIPLEELRTVAPPRIYTSFGGHTSTESNICILSVSSTSGIKGLPDYSFILGGPFFRKVPAQTLVELQSKLKDDSSDNRKRSSRAYVVMKNGGTESDSVTGIAAAILNETKQEIIELIEPDGSGLRKISGDEPAATEKKNRTIKALAGGLGGGGGFLLLTLGYIFYRYRKKHPRAVEPSIPSPDPDFVWQRDPLQPDNPPVYSVDPPTPAPKV